MALLQGETPRCPFDGGRMGLLDENRLPGRHRLRLYWCAYCQIGSAVLGDTEGALKHASFKTDEKTGTLVVVGSSLMQDAVADFVATRRKAIERLVYAE